MSSSIQLSMCDGEAPRHSRRGHPSQAQGQAAHPTATFLPESMGTVTHLRLNGNMRREGLFALKDSEIFQCFVHAAFDACLIAIKNGELMVEAAVVEGMVEGRAFREIVSQ